MGRTAAPTEEGTIQETVALCLSERPRAVKALTTLQPWSASMANKATVGFLFSVTGGAYQIISPYVAAIVDRNSSPYYYVYSFETLILTSFLMFWGASHLLEDWKGRITWPFLIFALGIANLSSIIMAYYIPNTLPFSTPNPLLNATLSLIPGPLLIIIGGIVGFLAVRQFSRDGHAVLGHA